MMVHTLREEEMVEMRKAIGRRGEGGEKLLHTIHPSDQSAENKASADEGRTLSDAVGSR